MQTGDVKIDFGKLTKDYPLSTEHILAVLLGIKDVSYKVNEEDNEYYDSDDNEYRVRITYGKDNETTDSFTLLLEGKYITFE